MALKLISPSFKEGEAIPKRFSCEGDDISPELHWTGLPNNTKSLALICEDPDAPVGIFIHWVIYNIPPEKERLPENMPNDEKAFDGIIQGKNSFGNIGYGGPCPPSGSSHRYVFKLFALDTELDLEPGATKQKLLDAIKGHILDETALMGTYKR